MVRGTIKEEARKLVEQMSDNATWDDLQYEIYVRQTVEAGLADSDADRVEDVANVRRSFGLAP